jgi:hypothetical protein
MAIPAKNTPVQIKNNKNTLTFSGIQQQRRPMTGGYQINTGGGAALSTVA